MEQEKIGGMPAQFLILRIVLGLMCVGFAFCWGRSVGGGRHEPARRGTGTTSWAVRTGLTGLAMIWGAGPDVYAMASWALAGISWGSGFFLARKPKEPEADLTKEMFPDD